LVLVPPIDEQRLRESTKSPGEKTGRIIKRRGPLGMRRIDPHGEPRITQLGRACLARLDERSEFRGKGDTFSVRQHAEDLATFIEALGVGPIHVVAHSRGGSVAVRTAQAWPALVKKLVLMEGAFGALLQMPVSGDAGPGLSAIAKATKARFDQGDIEGGLELWWDRDTPGAWARRSEEGRQTTRDNAWTLIAGGSDNPVTCADLAGFRMVVLLMQGEKTPRRLASIVDATHKCLPSAERATIPDAGHAMHFMNPAGFEKMLVQFLSR
jgi:pimeloyl-ACP methyl ester carboxylesterase